MKKINYEALQAKCLHPMWQWDVEGCYFICLTCKSIKRLETFKSEIDNEASK